MVGDGRFKSDLMHMVNSYAVIDMFVFIPRQPVERIPELMAVCDASLICMAKGDTIFSMTIPAKTQTSLACGIPISVSADGELQKIIKESQAGVCSKAGDSEALAGKISGLVSRSAEELAKFRINVLEYHNRYFNKEDILKQMDKYFV